MTRCFVYSRVSTDTQERDGTSLDTQERACIDLARSRGWEVVQTVRDAASGFDLDRPGVETLRSMLRTSQIDVVLAYAVDRLSRNQNHIGVLFDEVHQAGAQLEFVTERFEDTAIGRFILAARAFIAEVEREKIAERTMRGKAERARSGRLPQGSGRGIYGYTYDSSSGTRNIEPVQARVVRRIFEDFVAGGSCHGIATALNRESTPAFGGGRWYALTIRRVLLNEAYAGRTVYRRTKAHKLRDSSRSRWVRRVEERDSSEWIEIVGATPAIVSVDLFRRAQARLSDPERRRRGKPSRQYALRGRIRCSLCEGAMVGHAVNHARYHYYRCPNGSSGPGQTRCGARYHRVERVEASVRGALAEVLAAPERLIAEVRRAAGSAPAVDHLRRINAELAQVEEQQRRLIRVLTRTDLPDRLVEEESTALARRRAELERQRLDRERESRLSSGLDVNSLTRDLPRALAAISRWVESAEGADFDLLVRALNAKISIGSEEIEVSGEVPLIAEVPQSFATIEQTSA